MKHTSSDIAPNATTFEDYFGTSSRKGCRARGYALLSVMFGLVLIGIIAGQFGMMVRTDLTKSNNLLIAAQADATVEAIALRVANGFVAERGKGFWEAAGAVYTWQENAFDIRMTIETDNGAGQTTNLDLSAPLLTQLIMAHGRSADEAKAIANDILAVSQSPSGTKQPNRPLSSSKIDGDGNRSRRALLLAIDGMDDELFNNLIHVIPSPPTSLGPVSQGPQDEKNSEPFFDDKIAATASKNQSGIFRLTDADKNQKSPLSAVKMKIRLQQSGKIVRDVRVRVILTGPKEAPVRIIRM